MKILEKILNGNLPKYLFGAILIIVPLFPKFPLLSVPGTYVSIRFEDLLLMLLVIMTFVKIVFQSQKFFKDEIIKAVLLFLLIGVVSLLSGIFVTKTVSPTLGLFNYLRRIEYLVPFFAALYLFHKHNVKTNLIYFINILVIVTIIAFLYGLGQRYLNFPIIITQNDSYSKGVALFWNPGSHISSTFAGHYDLAAFMVMLLPIFISLFVLIKNKWQKLILLLTISSALWLLVNSLSRISQVSYLIAISVALILARKFKALGVILVVSIALIGMSSSLNARFMRFFDVYLQKVKVIKTSFRSDFIIYAQTETLPAIRINTPKPTTTPKPVFEDRSTSIRLVVEWPRAIRSFKINPLLGTGYSSNGLATDNDFLRMIAETGILGFLAFMLIFIRLGAFYLKSFSVIKKMSAIEFSFIIGLIGAIFGLFVNATFIDLFEASKFATIFWLLIGLSVSLIRSYQDEQIN